MTLSLFSPKEGVEFSMSNEPKVLFGELHSKMQFYWLEHTQQFIKSYYGNDMLYYNYKLREWVSPEDASMYPLEIEDARAVFE